jgi:hypothetical protein
VRRFVALFCPRPAQSQLIARSDRAAGAHPLAFPFFIFFFSFFFNIFSYT